MSSGRSLGWAGPVALALALVLTLAVTVGQSFWTTAAGHRALGVAYLAPCGLAALDALVGRTRRALMRALGEVLGATAFAAVFVALLAFVGWLHPG